MVDAVAARRFRSGVGLNDDSDAANKLVDEANVLINQNNELETKSGALSTELLGGVSKVNDQENYKKVNKSKFDELTGLSEQSVKLLSEAADKFEQASKLKLEDKYKEYLGLKVQEFRKRIEADKLVAPICKLFLEIKFDSKGVDVWNKGVDDYNVKTAEFIKEADELSKKADQLAKDNPTVIKN